MSSFNVIGVDVHAVSIADVVARMETWITTRDRMRAVSLVNAHVAADAARNIGFARVLADADLRVPDGTPVVWVGRMRGQRLPERVEGLELMDRFFSVAAARGYRSFFYGAGPGIAERVGRYMTDRFPGTVVAGTYTPPYRELTAEEDAEAIARINDSGADVLWVSLGGPKEHQWINQRRHRLRVPVAVTVGQAFDTLSGKKRRLPMWVRRNGLEWAVRLVRERNRLWKRYLVFNTLFLVYLFADGLGLGPSSRKARDLDS